MLGITPPILLSTEFAKACDALPERTPCVSTYCMRVTMFAMAMVTIIAGRPILTAQKPLRKPTAAPMASAMTSTCRKCPFSPFIV